MAHNHFQKDEEHHSYRNVKIAALINIFFTVLEFIGGAVTNSLALTANALHDLGDSIVLLSSWKIEHEAFRKPDWKKTFGYRRLSLLAAFLNAVILLGGSLVVIFQITGRLINPQPVSGKGMILFAFIGIGANLVASFRLRNGESLNEKILSWHLLEDVFGWLGILISGILIHFSNLYILDPLVSIGFTLFIMWGVWRNSTELINVFLEGVPSKASLQDIVQAIERLREIKKVYDVHLWSLDGKHHVFSMKGVITNNQIRYEHKIIQKIERILHKHHVNHVTIELTEERHYSKKDQEQGFLNPT